MKPYTKEELSVGMPVMYEAKTAVISRVDGDYLDISDGYFLTGTSMRSARCYPITKYSLWAADTVRYQKDELYKIKQTLNWPDINRKLMSYFDELCDAAEEKDAMQVVHDRMVKFCRDVHELVYANSNVSVDGVEVFKS